MKRVLTPELMDDPAIDAGEHARALEGLARLNRLSGSARILWPGVERAARERGGRASVLDVATGSGDVPIALAGLAERAGVSLELAACDVSEFALERARRRARDAGVGIECVRADALRTSLEAALGRRFDVVTCSLFMHHLDSDEAVLMLRHAAAAAEGELLVSDLRRCVPGLAAAWGVPQLLTRSRVVHVDAVKSVRAAWTPREALRLAEAAGLQGAHVERRWPWRMLLSWRRA